MSPPENIQSPPAPVAAAPPKPPATRVLLVEDSPMDARLIRAMLSSPRGRVFELVQAGRLSEGLERLNEDNIGLVLLDLSLPDSNGLETFTKLYAAAPHVPIIVMSGLDDETVAGNAVHAGAQDYLVKGEVTGHVLVRAIRYAIERKRTEEALQHAEAFHRSLVESLPQKILRKDLLGRFTFGNQLFLAEVGLTLEQFVGKTDFDFFPAELAAKYQEDDRKVIAAGKMFETVEEHDPPGGGKRYVQVVKTPIYNADGTSIGIQGIFWDVTERKLAEEQLKRANWELAKGREESLKMLADLRRTHNELKETQLELIQMEKLQLVGRLAAGVAHEVKNPLAIIRMGLDFLSNSPAVAASNATPIIADMTDATRRADSIIMGLLDFSAPGKLLLQEADTHQLIEESLHMVKHELAAADVKVVKEFAAGLPPAVVDQNKIKQALVNLVTNAIHAMPEGGTLTLRTAARRLVPEEARSDRGARETTLLHAGEWGVIVEIEDTGTGIAPERLTRIFDPFFTTKATGKGTGLGLTVTKKILELHGGTIEITNRPDAGVRVTLMLRATETNHGKEKILIVDDEAVFTRMVKLNLEQTGQYEVREENRALRALPAAREFKPDLILLDVIMPGMDGGELAASLQADYALRKTPIVFLTATVSPSEAKSGGFTSGGFLFLAKPVALKDLIQCIETHVKPPEKPPGAK